MPLVVSSSFNTIKDWLENIYNEISSPYYWGMYFPTINKVVLTFNGGLSISIDEGDNWYNVSVPTLFTNIIEVAGIYYANGYDNNIYQSNDLETWTVLRSNISGTLIYNSFLGLFMNVSSNGVYYLGNSVLGMTQRSYTPNVYTPRNAFIVNNKFYIDLSNAYLLVSSDGINWTYTSPNLEMIIEVSGKLCGFNSSSLLFESLDGATWADITPVNYSVFGLVRNSLPLIRSISSSNPEVASYNGSSFSYHPQNPFTMSGQPIVFPTTNRKIGFNEYSIFKEVSGTWSLVGGTHSSTNTINGLCGNILGNQIVAPTTRGIHYSLNNGSTWNNRRLFRDYNVKSIACNSTDFFYATDFGLYKAPVNNPTNISLISSLGTVPFREIINANGVLLANSSAGNYVYRSIDGGTTWTTVPYTATMISYSKLNNTIYLINSSSYRSLDQGASWIPTSFPVSTIGSDASICFFNNFYFGFSATKGVSKGSFTSNMSIVSNMNMVDYMIDSMNNNLLMLSRNGSTGTILRTTSDGNTWNSNTLSTRNAISFTETLSRYIIKTALSTIYLDK